MFDYQQLRYFSRSEFARPDEMNSDLLIRLDNFRKYVNKPMKVLSSNDPDQKHVDNSFHYSGMAVDLVVPDRGDLSPFDLLLAALRFGFTGIGVYPDWMYNNKKVGGLHLDVRPAQINGAQWLGIKDDNKQTYLSLNEANLRKFGVI